MNFERDTKGGIPQDCIDNCRSQLESDPGGQAVWVIEEGHAYFIGSRDEPKTRLSGILPDSIRINDQIFKIEQRTVRELQKLIKKGEAFNITNLIKKA